MNEGARSTSSIIAIASALGSFVLSSRDRPIVGFIVAIAAVLFGMIGFLRAVSPRVRGGMLSVVAIVLGVIAMLVALLRLLF